MVEELAEANHRLLNRENELRRKQFFQEVFNQTLTRLIASTDLNTGLNDALGILCPAIDAEIGLVYLAEGRQAVPAATWNFDGEPPGIAPGKGFPGVVFREHKRLVIADIPADFPFKIRKDPNLEVLPRVMIAQPIPRAEQVLGVILVGSTKPFSPEHLDLLERVSIQAGLAVTHALHLRRAMDLTRELKFKSESLKHKYSELEKASRTKSMIFAGISHELKTPLNAIIGFSRVLLKKTHGDLSPDQEAYARLILKNGEHLLTVINEILDYARLDAEAAELPLADLNLSGEIEDCLLSMRPLAERKRQKFLFRCGTELPGIRTNRNKLKQILFNLLSNAVKFSPEGSEIEIATRLSEYGDEVRVTVSDHGPGIPPEDRERVFEPFFRASQASATEGTGLGLSLTRGMVERLGGRIRVEPGPDGGSAFSFTLPVAGFEPGGTGRELVKARGGNGE